MASLITAQGSKAIDSSGPPGGTAISLGGGNYIYLKNLGTDEVQFDVTDSGDATKVYTAGDFELASGEELYLEVRNANSLFAICDAIKTATLKYIVTNAGIGRG